MKTKYQFIHFEQENLKHLVGESLVWICLDNKSNCHLGTVEFYNPWNQWTFAPTAFPSMYSSDCLNDIAHFISQLEVPCRKDKDVVSF